MTSASLAGDESSIEYPFEGEGSTMATRTDVLGENAMVLTNEDLTLDWGAGSLGIDLGYGYRVKRIILKPTTTNRIEEENLQIFTSLYNLDELYQEVDAYTYEEDPDTGEITILLDNMAFARYIKIHSHFYDMAEDGTTIKGTPTFELPEEDPFDLFILSSGRNEFYAYDGKGNRESQTFFTREFEAHPYSYYPNSDLIKTAGDTGYTYDNVGNMLEKGSFEENPDGSLTMLMDETYKRFEYDLQNRLVALYSWDTIAGEEVKVKEYTYNAQGLRILSEDVYGQNVRYTFDQAGQVIERTENTTTRNYIYLGSKVIAHVEEGTTYYYGTDHLGSTTMITDVTGAKVWAGEVTPFADQESSEGALSEKVLYTGKELDQDAGLYYFNARWYDANLGRFTTEDPIRDGANWHAYVNNNPLRFVDPSGLRNVVYDDINSGRAICEGDSINVLVRAEGGGFDFSISPKLEGHGVFAKDIASATFTIEETGESFRRDFLSSVDKREGLNISGSIFLSFSEGKGSFKAGDSPEFIVEQYEGEIEGYSGSSSVELLSMGYGKYESNYFQMETSTIGPGFGVPVSGQKEIVNSIPIPGKEIEYLSETDDFWQNKIDLNQKALEEVPNIPSFDRLLD